MQTPSNMSGRPASGMEGSDTVAGRGPAIPAFEAKDYERFSIVRLWSGSGRVLCVIEESVRDGQLATQNSPSNVCFGPHLGGSLGSSEVVRSIREHDVYHAQTHKTAGQRSNGQVVTGRPASKGGIPPHQAGDHDRCRQPAEEPVDEQGRVFHLDSVVAVVIQAGGLCATSSRERCVEGPT